MFGAKVTITRTAQEIRDYLRVKWVDPMDAKTDAQVMQFAEITVMTSMVYRTSLGEVDDLAKWLQGRSRP